jgi:DNA polymerase-4
VARRARRAELLAGGVRVKLKTAEFNLLTRQAPLDPRTSSAKELFRVASQLLTEFDLTRPIRLVGLAVYDLDSDGNGPQGVLFKDENREKQKKLDAALDAVLDKFGDNALKRGSH